MAEEACGEQLVVCAEECGRVVQHEDSTSRERTERPEAVVHPVERREHVEPAERHVAGDEDVERLLGRHELPARARGLRQPRALRSWAWAGGR